MLNNKKIVVVMPAYNAEKTLRKTYDEIPKDVVDDIILTDDNSGDKTVEIAKDLKLSTFIHDKNLGYGGNQKTCYREASKARGGRCDNATPGLSVSSCAYNADGGSDNFRDIRCRAGSRILGNKALKGGMPLYKYVSNRMLTLLENNIIGEKLSEYHTGYRAFSREVLLNLPITRKFR